MANPKKDLEQDVKTLFLDLHDLFSEKEDEMKALINRGANVESFQKVLDDSCSAGPVGAITREFLLKIFNSVLDQEKS